MRNQNQSITAEIERRLRGTGRGKAATEQTDKTDAKSRGGDESRIAGETPAATEDLFLLRRKTLLCDELNLFSESIQLLQSCINIGRDADPLNSS